MIESVRSYLAIFSAPPEAEAERLRALATALATLDYVYHSAAEVPFVEFDDPPPRSGYKATCAIVARAFPKFGFYAVVTLDPDPDAKVMVGDAIDDLADIALELEEVEWLWDNRGPQEAAWQFQFGYRSHWGTHLHDVQRYVHRHYLKSHNL